jgi:hypothetical protein
VYRLKAHGIVQDGAKLDTTSARGYRAGKAPFLFELIRLVGQLAMRHRGATWFALVGYVESEENEAFDIGDGIERWEPANNGELSAYLNDARRHYENNRGCIELTTTRLQ